MKNKVYYGEYTLKHWIRLMLREEIVLPEYQRHFVWSERDLKRLITSFKEGQFVQPVTIALYDDTNEKMNLILDGQQRLTSILLAYLGYFPDKKKFEEGSDMTMTNEDDSASDEQHENKSILWQYTKMLSYGKNREKIQHQLEKDSKYKKLDSSILEMIDDDFFENSYLGFSYVVPESRESNEIQKNFSQLFRNINYFGKKLGALESRRSLYYQNSELTSYFEGKCSDGTDVIPDIFILDDWKPCKIDFVRYLSILSQFKCSVREDAKDVMVGYSAYSSRENYYADYVAYILGLEQEERTNKFDKFVFEDTFPEECWKERFERLRQTLVDLKPQMNLNEKNAFSTLFEADYWLFGCIYFILFEGKSIDIHKEIIGKRGIVLTLSKEITKEISRLKEDEWYKRNANRLGNVRQRIIGSYEIFKKYVHE